MGIEPSIFFGKVMHKRLFPRGNRFVYGIYYLAFPLSKMQSMPMALNRFAPLSFYERDHGDCNGRDLESWARGILENYNITAADGDITLVCMPRVMGYVFNPVSFWLCHDKDNAIRAVICEVHNTFGEHHSYLCAHPDQKPITSDDVLTGEKLFHVSPFLKREGHYTFRFDINVNAFNAWINFHDGNGDKQLVTSLNGALSPMDARSLRKAFWCYPLVTVKAIILIHWQALKLVLKGIKHIPKPKQNAEKLSATKTITKM